MSATFFDKPITCNVHYGHTDNYIEVWAVQSFAADELVPGAVVKTNVAWTLPKSKCVTYQFSITHELWMPFRRFALDEQGVLDDYGMVCLNQAYVPFHLMEGKIPYPLSLEDSADINKVRASAVGLLRELFIPRAGYARNGFEMALGVLRDVAEVSGHRMKIISPERIKKKKTHNVLERVALHYDVRPPTEQTRWIEYKATFKLPQISELQIAPGARTADSISTAKARLDTWAEEPGLDTEEAVFRQSILRSLQRCRS